MGTHPRGLSSWHTLILDALKKGPQVHVIECVSITGPVIPDQFPVPRQEIIRVLRAEGLDSTSSGFEIVLRGEYDSERLSHVTAVVKENGWDLAVEQTVVPVFSDDDFSNAELLSITLSTTVWIDEIDFHWVCAECGKKRLIHDLSASVSRVPSDLPMASVNGQFLIVRHDIRKEIERRLSGGKFCPFDEQGKYFHFGATSSVGQIAINPDETIGYEGDCKKCGFPVFRVLFGPYRHLRKHWDGQDIVNSAWLADNVVSQTGYQVLRSMSSGIELFRPVVLEG
jgi:hypothetical protein